jgi:quercetin dioxygenase-like cupin family protein
MRRILFLAGVLCFAASSALAQDVTKVAGGPETHKVVLENEHIRVLDVHVPPGKTIAMHSHPPNTVYYITDSKTKVTGPDGKSQVVEAKAGTAIWRDETKHAVENVGTAEIHLVQVEIKPEAKAAKPAAKKPS